MTLLSVSAYARDPLTSFGHLLSFANDAGLAHVQLAWEQVVRAGPGETAEAAVVRRLEEQRMQVIGLDATVLDCLDAETFETQTDNIYLQLRAAACLDAAHVTISAGPRGPANFAHVADALKRLTVLADRTGIGISIRNVCHSSVEQLDDVRRLFRLVGADNLTLDLDMAEFQAAVVNPYDAVISFPGRVARLRACDVNLPWTLTALKRDGFSGPVLVAVEDGLQWARRVRETCT